MNKFLSLVLLMSLNSIAYANLAGKKIGIDPGHGGSDPGAIGISGLKEKDVALGIALATKKYLQRDGATVIITREDDSSLSLSSRTNYLNSNQVDKTISIHLNSISNHTTNRTMDFVYCGDCDRLSGSLADNVLEKLAISTGLDRSSPSSVKCSGVSNQECSGKPGVGQANLYMVRETKHPATLVEVSFISNSTEEQKLRKSDYIDKQGWAIYAGIAQEYGSIPLNRDNSSDSGTSNNSSISGIFDGAGSLVSPKEDGAGKNWDVAVMQPHPGTGSTVVFQWLYDSKSCKQIDLFASKNIDVAVKAKTWDSHYIEKAFKVTLGKDSGVTLKKPTNSFWTTFAVTSIDSVNKATKIYAICQKSNAPFNKGNSMSIDKELVDVTYGYYWTGTGSIISTASREFNPPFGMTADWTETFDKHQSLTSFQWLKSYNCKKLRLSEQGSSKKVSLNGVFIKKWDQENWGDNQCSSLPCVLSPSTNEYFVIKIKSNAGVISHDKYLQAECIE
jgi:N-acetylmuramoyl-L-alanine amidase